MFLWGKSHHLKTLLKTHEFDLNKTIYIGDEIRDIEAAHKVGIRIAAVTWGYNSKKALESYHPDFLITEPQQLLNLIE